MIKKKDLQTFKRTQQLDLHSTLLKLKTGSVIYEDSTVAWIDYDTCSLLSLSI